MAQVQYWVDADCLIERAKYEYAFDIVPGYWDFLVAMARRNIILSPIMVYQEVREGVDALSSWVEEHKETLFEYADEAVQDRLSDVADYVRERYPVHGEGFLNGADPFLIAHAMVQGGRIATGEKPKPQNAQTPRIPNVASHFGIECVTVFEMLRKLGAEFHWHPTD